MSWAKIGMLLLLVFVAYSIYLFRLIRHQNRPLNLSDHLGIANLIIGSLINAIVLIVAIASLKIAFDSFYSAKQSGDEQLKALEAARKAIITTGTEQKISLDQSHNALDSVVKIAAAQQKLLSKSLMTSKTQLTIIQKQRQRELERPNIYAELVNTSSLEKYGYTDNLLAIKVYNRSHKVARDVIYRFIMIDLERPNGTGHFETCYINSDTLTPIAPGPPFLTRSLQLNGPVPNKSDRLFGYLYVECPECETQRVYWLYYKYDEAGWYHEGASSDYPDLFKITSNNVNEVLKSFQKHPNLLKITEF